MAGIARQRNPAYLQTMAGSPAAAYNAQPAQPMDAPAYDAPQFEDPSQQRVEQHAISQYNALSNPDPNSATAQYENYLGTLGQDLQKPAYSQSEVSIYTGSMLDQMERDKQAMKQRYVEELGRRNISMGSGAAIEGLLKIDNHYAGLRTGAQTDFAKKAIDDTRANRMQAASVMGQRAQSEQGRQQQAGVYAAQPYQLLQDSFARNASVANGGGSPQAYLQSATQVGQGQYTVNRQQQQDQASALQAMFELLAYQGQL